MMVVARGPAYGVGPYMDDVAIRDVAARLRTLVGPSQGGARLDEAAEQMGVAELDLLRVLEGRGHRPSLESLAEVCTAAVRRFGVDPAWLVTGECDPALHRLAAELGVDRGRLRALVTDLLRRGAGRRPLLA